MSTLSSDSSPDGDQSKLQLRAVLDYHRLSKHEFPNGYAASPGWLDWASQPFPFRRFVQQASSRPGAGSTCSSGASVATVPCVPLPLPASDLRGPRYSELFDPAAAASSDRTYTRGPEQVSVSTVSQLLYYALSLSAWKEAGPANRWSLRVNPSSGNLHPTEAYVIAGTSAIPELRTADSDPHEQVGVFHYAPDEHVLERRARFELRSPEQNVAWSELFSARRRLCGGSSFLVALSSVHIRESWKYGVRAFRYCQHDVGHAISCLAVSAAMLGWRAHVVDGVSDADLSALIGVDRAADFVPEEQETSEVLVAVWVPSPSCPDHVASWSAVEPRGLAVQPRHVRSLLAGSQWAGRANRLARSHRVWPLVQEVAAATARPQLRAEQSNTPPALVTQPGQGQGQGQVQGQRMKQDSSSEPFAAQLVRQRRSAVDTDGRSSMPLHRFLAMLQRLHPGRNPHTPWNAMSTWPVCVHLLLFVHRVDGLAPGLYALCRQAEQLAELQAAVRGDWQQEGGADSGLFRLASADLRDTAMALCCMQEIAANGAFAVAMLTRFEPVLSSPTDGLPCSPHLYRRLFWEAGAVGQLLYLEAEAAGMSGTGIGCFFDDALHSMVLAEPTSLKFQSLYHFAVGKAVHDPRLRLMAGYGAKLSDRLGE